MIPDAFITSWARRAPWQTRAQIEQDLILSRLMIEIANHELLGSELAVLNTLKPDAGLIVDSLHRYMGDGAFGFADFASNLRDKLRNKEFRADLEQLLAPSPAAYEPEVAADTVMERLGSRLADALPMDSIRYGAWRL